MDLSDLIAALSQRTAFRELKDDDQVEVRQTHISVVFLAGHFAYKIKKPVDLGFLDYSTLDARFRMCEQEVRLNRRLARDVYVGVVPVTQDGSSVVMEGHGAVVEWAVKMKRLPDEAMLRQRLIHGQVDPAHVEELARRIARFHKEVSTSEHAADFATFEAVARNVCENFEQAEPLQGLTVSRRVLSRLRAVTDDALRNLEPLIGRRASQGIPRDTHGDLRLSHVYHFPSEAPPADWIIMDCIEFNERFRYADPVADVAFLAMDFIHQGRSEFAGVLRKSYVHASGDQEGRSLWPFYVAYRAAVRGKVEGMKVAAPEFPESERAEALNKARAYWLLALGTLEEPDSKPCLVLIGGLPGTGKSTLAQALAARAGFEVIRSDVVRKELAGMDTLASASAPFGEGIYAAEWNERTYAECLRRAEERIFEGRRVIIDASFRTERQRQRFLATASRWDIRVLFLICQAHPEEVRARLEARRTDASDAGWSIYQQAAAHWDELSAATLRVTRVIETDHGTSAAVEAAMEALRAREVASS